MIFHCVINVDGLSIKVNAMSFPVVILSHWTQEDKGVATYLWDNAFAQVGRLPFQVLLSACWTDLAGLISARFYDQTGRCLTSDNLSYLKGIILPCSEVTDNASLTNRKGSQHNVSWQSFCIANLPGKNHSFWYWIFMVLKTITKDDKTPIKSENEKKMTKNIKVETNAKKTVLKIWQRGHLMGFVSSDTAAELLQHW